MPLVINTNIAAMTSQRFLMNNQRAMSDAMARLSSGQRINSAGDDAAGLVIANRMTSQTRGLAQAIRNASDGLSMIQVAEGALQESSNILQRIRELSIQSANGIYSDRDRSTLNAEVQQLLSELTRISTSTRFNGQTLLDGSIGNINLQTGINSGERISLAMPDISTNTLGSSLGSFTFLGDELALASNGTLQAALEGGAISINGQTLGSLAAGSSVESLLDNINAIDGITAKAALNLAADNTGTGVISGGDKIELNAVRLDGSTQTYTIQNTANMDELIDKINATGTMRGELDDTGKLTISSDQFARLSIADTTAGLASGMDVGTIEDPQIASIMDGLNNYWITEAVNLISTHFGISATGQDLTLSFYEGEVGGTLASVSASFEVSTDPTKTGTNITLNIDLLDFDGENLPSGGTGPYYADRVIAHEMVHAVMNTFYNTPLLPGWFTEGIAEFITGADERLAADYSLIDTPEELTSFFKTTPGSPTTSAGYSASYLAVKYLQDQLTGGDIKALFNELELGQTLDAAIAATTSYGGLAAFEADFLANGVAYLGGLKLSNADTGSVFGFDEGVSGTQLDAVNVLPNNTVAFTNDFNFIVPDEYSGTAKAAYAQISLTSETDTLTIQSGPKGSDSALNNLGMREYDHLQSLLGAEVTPTNQAQQLNAGDLFINGAAVTTLDAGLMAKVDAINALSDQTSVVANIEAKADFNYTSENGIEKFFNAGLNVGLGGTLGINGVFFSIDTGDGANEVAQKINVLTDYHGTTAYVDSSGRLHIASQNGPINLAAGGGSILSDLSALGPFTTSTDVGSIRLNGTYVALSNLNDKQTIVSDINLATSITGVVANVNDFGQISLKSSAAIKVSIGDTNGIRSLNTLGITYSIDADSQANLVDSDSDQLLSDENFTIGPRIALRSLNDAQISVKVSANGERATGLSNVNKLLNTVNGSPLKGLNITSQRGASAALKSVDAALDVINNSRASLGAVSNRLNFTINNLMNVMENTAAAKSRILDADYALEVARMSRANILAQAAQSMLAQANAMPKQVLSLIRALAF